jgi:hypothetical protein
MGDSGYGYQFGTYLVKGIRSGAGKCWRQPRIGTPDPITGDCAGSRPQEGVRP